MRKNTNIQGSEEVYLKKMSLRELLKDGNGVNLKIPDYQRTYCWKEKQVRRLLHDVQHFVHKAYHMGTVILHKRNDCYDIVDGQQRLVTLTLLVLKLRPDLDRSVSLAEETFSSEEALKYVAYNKWLIHNYSKAIDPDKLLDNLQFSVLILSSANLDLAYTFFTSNSNRGKPLSDYNLLKSHHLRFIHLPEQAAHVAGRWDDLIQQSDNQNQGQAMARTFEINLFRLRQWMRRRTWDDHEQRKIKSHFEAAATIPQIPALGEQLHFNESIQGGTHFFAYAEHFIARYKEFSETIPYIQLHNHLSWEKHWWYRDVMEGLLFAYYLKFGNRYLCDALILISKQVAKHRYDNFRAYLKSIFKYIANSEVVMMLDQATSPTFFLAELKMRTEEFAAPRELTGTRKRFQKLLRIIHENLQYHSEINLEPNGTK